MDLFDEDILKPKKKKKVVKAKATTIIVVAIILLSILCVAAMAAIAYLRGTILTITLDEYDAKEIEEIIIMEENDKIYLPIRRFGEYLQYSTYDGDYITRSEDTTKCYIENQEEVVSFSLNSNVLTKVIGGQSQQIKITEPIKEINEELCITAEGAQDAFNLKFYYDKDKNDIIIQTLSYLYNTVSNNAVNNGYLPISGESFENRSAVLDGILIVKAPNNYYGVITTAGEVILETKYDSIQYLRKTSDFLVGSNGKKGIISSDKTTKVEPTYDNIERVTNKNDVFYVVTKANVQGVLNTDGEIIIYPEHEQIGIDVSAYKQNGVTNGYILYNKLIPVKRNNKWALFDINGTNKNVTDFIYDSFGCPYGKNTTASSYGVIQALDYNLIVGCKNEKYNFITLEGTGSNFILDSVHIIANRGEYTYYVSSGERTEKLEIYLQENGISKSTTTE